MKIGLFTDTFYPEINGVATSCLNLQRELTRRGHEVHVYAPKCKGWEENQRENVHYLASAPLLVLKDRNFAFPTPLTSWEAEKIDFDVVHTNSEFVMGMFGHHVAGSLGCAQVHTYHTVWEDYTYYITHGVADEAARRIARKYSQWWCNRFDRVITPTGKTLDLLRKYGVAAPIDIIPSGMDIARFDPARHGEQERLETRRECGLPEHAPLLLNIGRIAKEKNLEQVMRVFPRLLNACPDVHFAVVGEGPMREELGRMAECGETLTADALDEKYLALNRLYFGPDMISDAQIALEWARIPHFYYNYYVFQYATGFSAAVALADRILREGEPAVADYKRFLSGGSSTDPISLLKLAGVDMSTPAPVDAALAMFGELVDELDALTR